MPEEKVIPAHILLPASTNLSAVYNPVVMDRLTLVPNRLLSDYGVDTEEMVRCARCIWKGKDENGNKYPPEYKLTTENGNNIIMSVKGAEDTPHDVIEFGEQKGFDDVLAVTGWDFLLAELYGIAPYELLKDGKRVPVYRQAGREFIYTNPQEFSIGDSGIGDEFIFERAFRDGDNEYVGRITARVVHDYKTDGGYVPRIIIMSKSRKEVDDLLHDKSSKRIACEYRIQPIVEAYLRSINATNTSVRGCTRKAETAVSRFGDRHSTANMVADIVFSGRSAEEMGLKPDRGAELMKSNVVALTFSKQQKAA